MAGWRSWLGGRRGRPASTTAVAVPGDLWEQAGRRRPAPLPVIAEIEADALGVYAAEGLPTRHGHYRRGPDDAEWTWLAEDLPAETRWDMVLERPLEQGWRYATLEDIGRFPGAPAELIAAAKLLAVCRHLKDRLAGREPGEPGGDIQAAIRLGASWQSLKDAIAWKETARPTLTPPSDALPSPEPEAKPSKPRASRTTGSASAPRSRKPRKPATPKPG